MPELPEVESVRRSLVPRIAGRRIEEVDVFTPGVVSTPSPEGFRAALVGRRIDALERYGKYLAFRLDPAGYWLTHLRMTGRLHWSPHRIESPHLRLAVAFDDGGVLHFIDIRRFGRVAYLPDFPALERRIPTGVEPLKEEFTVSALKRALTGKAPVKSALLDQRRIAGLGNIYADEALFRARIHPARRLDTLSDEEIAALHRAIEAVLAEALSYGGTTVRDYRQGDGRRGEFAARLQVYGRAGEPCLRCGGILEKVRLGGRGTTFCPRCQR